MPAGPRIRANNSFGVTTDNPLTAGATSFNSAGLATLPVVSAAHAVVVLDPKRVFGAPEIVVVTTHTAAATVATITRGAYGTVARSHPSGTAWAHVPVDEDYIEIVTSTTRPSDPYEGQGIYETNTNKLAFYTGTDWAYRDAGGTLGANGTASDQTGITTTETAITGMTITITVPTGRRILVEAWGGHYSSVANDAAIVRLRRGSNPGSPGLDTLVKQWQSVGLNPTFHTHYQLGITEALAAGTYTYYVTLIRNGGSGTITHRGTSTDLAFIIAMDIGAS